MDTKKEEKKVRRKLEDGKEKGTVLFFARISLERERLEYTVRGLSSRKLRGFGRDTVSLFTIRLARGCALGTGKGAVPGRVCDGEVKLAGFVSFSGF